MRGGSARHAVVQRLQPRVKCSAINSACSPINFKLGHNSIFVFRDTKRVISKAKEAEFSPSRGCDTICHEGKQLYWKRSRIGNEPSNQQQYTLIGVRFWEKNYHETSLALAETCMGRMISSDVESHTTTADIVDLIRSWAGLRLHWGQWLEYLSCSSSILMLLMMLDIILCSFSSPESWSSKPCSELWPVMFSISHFAALQFLDSHFSGAVVGKLLVWAGNIQRWVFLHCFHDVIYGVFSQWVSLYTTRWFWGFR